MSIWMERWQDIADSCTLLIGYLTSRRIGGKNLLFNLPSVSQSLVKKKLFECGITSVCGYFSIEISFEQPWFP